MKDSADYEHYYLSGKELEAETPETIDAIDLLIEKVGQTRGLDILIDDVSGSENMIRVTIRKELVDA